MKNKQEILARLKEAKLYRLNESWRAGFKKGYETAMEWVLNKND